MKGDNPTLALAAAALGLFLMFGGAKGCSLPGIGGKATAVTYFYEKDQHQTPGEVAAALDKLNREGIVADQRDVDTPSGSGAIPAMYRISQPAAIAAGLPALVVMAGDKVRTVVKAPTTEAQVIEAVK